MTQIDKIADEVVNNLGVQSLCLVGVVVNEREVISLKWKSLSPSQILSILEQVKFNLLYNLHQKQNRIEDIHR